MAGIELEKDSYGHPRIPLRGHYDVKSCNERRKWTERFTSTSLVVTGEWWNNEGANDSVSCKKLQGNIENPIGLAKIPIGLAGPLLINGNHVSGYVVCPFATTEGALVASATRGAAVLTRSGGVRCRVFEQVMMRAPVFVTTSFDNAEILYTWILMNKQGVQKQVKLYSEFSLLIDIGVQRFGKNIVVLLKFTTSDAAGQNMVTTATWHACKWIIKEFESDNPSIKINKFFVESMFSGDKRMTVGNYSSHRGTHVIAEAWIPRSVIETTFKTTVEDLLCLYEIAQSTCARAGTIGCSINVANTLAAIFTATGQDIAGVVECAADLIIEPASYSHSGSSSDSESGIYACLVLPSLVIGTVGGGTGLATQMECLKMIDCYGTGKVARLAEIIAGFALSLDLSTLASVSNGTFAMSHERLGKNRPDSGFKKDHINNDLFSNVVKELGTLVSWAPFGVNSGNSILSELAKSERLKKIIGHFGFKIQYRNKEGQNKELKVVLKSKTVDTETCNVINKMAQNCGFGLARNYEKYKMDTGFKNCHIRELNLAGLNDSVLQEYIPKVYHTILNAENDVFVCVMEYLSRDDGFSHLDAADDISEWTIPDIKVVLRDLAKIHSHFISHERKEWLHSTSWLREMGPNQMKKLQPLWIDLLKHAELEFPDFWNSEKVQFLRDVIGNIPHYWSQYETAQKTLVHNDCNPRNICIRKAPKGTAVSPVAGGSFPYNDLRKVCMYDWELARIDIPQHDLAEFLAFTLPIETNLTTRKELIEFYRKHFELYSGIVYPNESFMTHYNIACLDFAVNRLLLYTMVHTYKDYRFLPRVIESHFSYIFQSMKTLIVKKSKL